MTARRPVGHVTDLVRRLNNWATRREEKNLDAAPLREASAYLKEYRELLHDRGKPL